MESQHQPSGNQAMLSQVYVGCSHEELIAIEMDAWKRGYKRADTDGPAAMRDLAVVAAASEAACDDALQVYVPMELGRFRDVFTLAWCAGYWTRVQEFGMPAA